MEQNQTPAENRLLKTFAVIGFIVLVIIGTWLAIQVVRLVPSAFSSLASLAESVEDGRRAQNEINITVVDAVVNSDESFTIAWSDLKRDGNYVINYKCVEGVALDVRIGNDIVGVPCETNFILPADVFSIDARFSSEKNRFTDIPYQIAFIEDGNSTPTIAANKVATVVNARIPQGIALGDSDTDIDTGTEMNTETDSQPTPSTPVTETPKPQTPATPTGVTYIKTFKEPVSDPHGYTELAVKYLGVGILDNQNRFITASEIDVDDKAAFQFEVKNTGTKTSTEWTFEATLTTGETYESKVQTPLKPNERAVLTVAFKNPGDDGFQTFGVEIDGGNDTKTNNNSFTWGVEIKD